jgi:hypothetical protein
MRFVVAPWDRRQNIISGVSDPWITPPPNSRILQQVGALDLPADGVNNSLVLSFYVPVGYDAVISGVTFAFTGTGWLDGSLDLVGRVGINRRSAEDLSNVIVSLGSPQQPFPLGPGGLRLQSQELVQCYVSVSADASLRLTPGKVIWGISGWYYPQQ